MEDNTHTSKQAYVRQPHPNQTTYKPHETKRPQPTRLYEIKVPCGAAYIIWPRKAVSLNICACQYCTPTKHLFYRPCPAAKHNVIPSSCYELLHTTPKTTFHSSTTSPSARNTPQQCFGFYQDRTGRSLRTWAAQCPLSPHGSESPHPCAIKT